MDNENKEVREDIGMIKYDIRAVGREEVMGGIEGISLAEARLYFRHIYNMAITELEKEDEE